MTVARQPLYTEAEYLALEADAPEKHEFVNGEAVAMAGASPAHNVLLISLARAVATALGGRPCLTFSPDQRVRIDETGLYAYPDLTVVCGPPRFSPPAPESLLNPQVIFEVLSDSTEAYDRGAKLAHYQRCASLQAYVLVASNEERVEVYRRADAGGWHYQAYEGDAVAQVLTGDPALALALTEVYAPLRLLNASRETG